MTIFQKMNNWCVDEISMAKQVTRAASRNKNEQILRDESAVKENERIRE